MNRRNAMRAAGRAGAVIMLFAGGGAAAQAAGGDVGEVVVTGSHFTVALGGASVSVLRPADAPAGADLGQLLGILSDVEVQRPGGPGGVASIFVRGAQPNFVTVMVEGTPLNDSTNTRGGSVDVSGLELFGIERAELVRGARSAVFGSGALGGVVNLILDSGKPRPQGVATAGAGTEGAAWGALSLRGPVGAGAGGAATLSYLDAGRPIDGSSRDVASISAKLAPLSGSRAYEVFVLATRSRAEAFPDDSGGPSLAVRRATGHRRDDRLAGGGRAVVGLASDVSVELGAAGAASWADDVSPGVAPGPRDPIGVPAGVSHARYVYGRGQAIVRYELQGWRWLGGLEVQRETGRSQGALTLFGQAFPSRFRLARNTVSGFAEAEWDHGPVTVQAALRFDRPDGLGDHVSQSLAGTWRLADNLTAHGAWGRAFKAPSFFALADAFVGNPGLRPERARSLEAGLSWTAGRGLGLEATAFRAVYADLIDFIAGPPPHLANRSAVLTRGADVAVTMTGERLGARLSTTYADTHDRSAGALLRALPRWRATAHAAWRWSPTVQLQLDVVYVGHRLESSVPTGEVELASYATADVRGLWKPRSDTQVELAVLNALDRRYQAAVGFRAPGLTARVAVRRGF